MKDIEAVIMEIFIPEEHVDALREALAEAGAGKIGKYDHCATVTLVRGYWRTLPGADPHEGEVGALSDAVEAKVAVRCPRESIDDALAAVRRVHPYEEPVVNIIPLG